MILIYSSNPDKYSCTNERRSPYGYLNTISLESLNASVFRDRRMYIDEEAAQVLLDKYMRK